MTFFRSLIILNLIIVLIVSSYSCASVIEMNIEVVDNDLTPYVETYHIFLDKYCPNKQYNTSRRYIITKTKRDDMAKDDWIGVCKSKLNGYAIEIQEEFFIIASEEDRQQLINHEMSHCLLYKEHTSNIKNYMYDTFITRPKAIYEAQLIKDIKDYCNE